MPFFKMFSVVLVSVYCKPGGGRKRVTRIGQNVDSVEKLVSSQENAPGTRITGMCKTSVHRIVKQ